MVVKNMLPIFHGHPFASYFPNSKASIGIGIQIKDAITNGQIKKDKNKFKRVQNLGILKNT